MVKKFYVTVGNVYLKRNVTDIYNNAEPAPVTATKSQKCSSSEKQLKGKLHFITLEELKTNCINFFNNVCM